MAEARGDVVAAARHYATLLAASPRDTSLAARAWRQAVASGDLTLARRAAAVLDGGGAGTLPTEVAVVAVAEAMKAGDRAALDRALAALGKGPLDFAGPVIAAWASFGTARDPAAAIAATKETGALARVVRENHVLLLIARERLDDAVPELRDLLGDDAGGLDLRYATAELLAGQGRGEIAAKLVGGDDSAVAGFRAAIPAARPSPAFGISRLFTRIAADLDDARVATMAVALTRAALLLDPTDDRARVLLARSLGLLKADDRALAVIAEVGAASPFRIPADEQRLALLRAKGDTAAALTIARGLAEAPGAGAFSAQIYGDLLSDLDRPADAAAAYASARDRLGGEAGWQVWLQLAGAYDRAGDWRRARDAYDRAVKLGPDEGVVLGAYGQALVERGDDLARAIGLLERADNLAPNRPEIAGALAWGYFRRGETARAVPLLEQASLAAPSDAAIAEHLGDAYWAAGRRYEARYAWNAAQPFAPPAAAARIAGKLRDGLARP